MSDDHDNLDYNKRQYARMLDCLRAYEEGHLEIDWLITNLEALVDALESPEPTWCEQFMHQWGIIEEWYAFAVADAEPGQLQLSQEAQAAVASAVARMKHLVDERLQGS